jgi:hypothetical protein
MRDYVGADVLGDSYFVTVAPQVARGVSPKLSVAHVRDRARRGTRRATVQLAN